MNDDEHRLDANPTIEALKEYMHYIYTRDKNMAQKLYVFLYALGCRIN